MFELVVKGEALSIHGSMEEATEVAEALPHGLDVLIRVVPADPALHSFHTPECYRFDPATRRWMRA